MSATAGRFFESMRELPADMQDLLRMIAADGPLSVTDIAHRSDMAGIKSKCLRLVECGLAIGNKHIGKTHTYYTATARGEGFVNPPGLIAPPRTIPYGGRYTPDPAPSWRPGQDHFLRIPSVGYRT